MEDIIDTKESGMDRPIDPAVLRKRFIKRVVTISLSAIAVLVLANLAFNRLRPSVQRDRILTAEVERGDVRETISASGVVVPEVEYVVTSPISTTIVKILKHPGDLLAAGDSLLVLDISARRLALARIEEEIRLKENQREQIAVDFDIQMNDLDSQRESRRLRLEAAEAGYRQQKRLYDMGGVSREQINEVELSVAIARIDFEQIERAIENAKKLTANRLEGFELEMRILENEREEAVSTILQARTIIDHGGVLTWIVQDEGASIAQGEIIARIADLNSYRVEATISEIHATRLSTGLPAIVGLTDGTRLEGRIRSIQPTIESGIVSFTVALDENADMRLRSNLRASVNLVTAEKRGVLRITRGPFAQGYGISDVFVIQGDRALRRETTFGIAGVDWLEVLDGLAEGDEVIVSDMSDRLYAGELRLR